MANLNKRTPKAFSKKEENELLKIPAGSGNAIALNAHAAKYGRSYHSVWMKHRALHEGTSTSTRVKPKLAKGIIPMTFQEVDFDPTHMRVDPKEQLAMEKGLEDAIKGPLNGTAKRAILFPKRLMGRAKTYLEKKHPKIVFSFHTKKGDSKNMLLARKN